jgi:hypothetical protein
MGHFYSKLELHNFWWMFFPIAFKQDSWKDLSNTRKNMLWSYVHYTLSRTNKTEYCKSSTLLDVFNFKFKIRFICTVATFKFFTYKLYLR